MSQLKKKTTLQDVANAVGVSIATVSRAINNKESVKEGTYDKIVQAIYALGYDAAVRHESHLILILLPDIDNPFYSEVIRGISSAAGRQGYQEIIVRTGAHPLTLTFIEEMIEKTHADGVITLDPIPSADTISQLELHTPLIQCAEYNENSPTSYVSIDDVAASRAVVEYILSKGWRRVALINGPLKYKYARKRQQGFIEGLEAAGITPAQNLIVQVPEFSYDAAVSIATQLLSMPERPDAIFAASDVFAVAAIKAAKRLGIAIPKDLGVIGFDNTNISVMSEPALTTVKQPQYQLGFLACEMLIEQMHSDNFAPRQIMLDAEIIIRESL
jgi:LacI family repressor for deo operon, udp, cdd, tsx, nupC, and nupG